MNKTKTNDSFLTEVTTQIGNGQLPTDAELARAEAYPDRAAYNTAFQAGEQAWETAHPGQVNPATGLGGSVDGIPPGLTDDDETGDALGIDPCAGFGSDDDENAPGSDL